MDRAHIEDRLVAILSEAYQKDFHFREDMILFGRTGLRAMTDEELLTCAHAWGLDDNGEEDA